MTTFNLVSDYLPTGDQPEAIDALAAGVEKGRKHQVLLGVTGSGKTFTMANLVARLNRPTLVLAHNKTLAAQLCAEFKEFFPENAVEYFVSYYDYYQPEAYIPHTDTYIEKDTLLNENIDRLRHEAMQEVLTRRDVIVVASVSCIYGLGAPQDYGQERLTLRRGEVRKRDKVLRHLTDIYYERNDYELGPGHFRVRGDTLEIQPSGQQTVVRAEFWGDEIERISELDPLTGEILAERLSVDVFPAKYFVTTKDRLEASLHDIEAELAERLEDLDREGKQLEAARLRQRTQYDLEMLRETGVCAGVENYSCHLGHRHTHAAGRLAVACESQPWTLLDYFPDDYLMFIDESHMSIPQVRGMFHGDRSRKQTLVDFGFRLPSAMDNRPLMFHEFERHLNQAIYVSATPGPYEIAVGRAAAENGSEPSTFMIRVPKGENRDERVGVYGAEQLVRPTGLIDPQVEVRTTRGQIDDLLGEINLRVGRGERVLVTTLTKRMAEDLADYLREMGVKVHYLHSEVDTLERVTILRDLRLGVYDVIVGINLLREGLDLPEVSLVAILDADKEGYLRSETALIQTIGRAARHVEGSVIMFADSVTDSMRYAIEETYRRRESQMEYNRRHGITPVGIKKSIRDISSRVKAVAEAVAEYSVSGEMPKDEVYRLIKDLEAQMKQASKELEFEKAALLRDQIVELRRMVVNDQELVTSITYTRKSRGRR